MKDIRSVMVGYFSGTGGTRKAAMHFAASCRRRGFSVEAVQIRAGAAAVPKADLLVLFYAVYCFAAPEPVYPWIAGLTDGEGTPAAVISVSGGGETTPNTACRVGVIRRLTRRGYIVNYEDMVVMPSNVLVRTDENVSIELLRILPEKMEKIAENILSGQTRRVRPIFIDRAFSAFGRMEPHGTHSYGKHIQVGDTCNGCAWCASGCPAGNIQMKDGRPVFGRKCLLCTRCMYGCPQKALTPSRYKSFLLKEGFSISELEKKVSQTPVHPLTGFPKGALYDAIKIYLQDDGNGKR